LQQASCKDFLYPCIALESR